MDPSATWMQSGVLWTTASGEGCKEEVQRQSGGADGADRHQIPIARATYYHGLYCIELIICAAQGEQQHR